MASQVYTVSEKGNRWRKKNRIVIHCPPPPPYPSSSLPCRHRTQPASLGTCVGMQCTSLKKKNLMPSKKKVTLINNPSNFSTQFFFLYAEEIKQRSRYVPPKFTVVRSVNVTSTDRTLVFTKKKPLEHPPPSVPFLNLVTPYRPRCVWRSSFFGKQVRIIGF